MFLSLTLGIRVTELPDISLGRYGVTGTSDRGNMVLNFWDFYTRIFDFIRDHLFNIYLKYLNLIVGLRERNTTRKRHKRAVGNSQPFPDNDLDTSSCLKRILRGVPQLVKCTERWLHHVLTLAKNSSYYGQNILKALPFASLV